MGLSPATTIRKVVLPAIRPALVSAAGLAFARSLGEFGTTLTFAGSMPGTTRTMPLGIYLAREIDQDLAYGLAAILVALALATLALSLLPTLLHRDPAPQARATHPSTFNASPSSPAPPRNHRPSPPEPRHSRRAPSPR
ncbi:ABC transporter permease subunit [Corynebacterium aquatimens]|uniref:ABC transporter permease subunit n=1 Tax=Corynebacterium aquatimens TaxID=1190508 RepID=UPI002541CFB7|nr:ABC transporter permease subunit [Corynebacterium aquatimens]